MIYLTNLWLDSNCQRCLYACQQRLFRDFYDILSQVSPENIPNDLLLPDSFDQLVSGMKSKQYDIKTLSFMLRGLVCFFQPCYTTTMCYLSICFFQSIHLLCQIYMDPCHFKSLLLTCLMIQIDLSEVNPNSIDE